MNLDEALALANQSAKAQQFDEAKALYLQILQQVPDEHRAMNGLGLVGLNQGNWAEAAQWIEQAIAIHNMDAGYFSNLALLYVQLKQFEQAIVAANKALTMNPQLAAACNNMGLAYLEQGLWEEATPWFERALALEPHHEQAHFNMARITYRQGRLDLAEQHVRSVIGRNPRHVEAHWVLGSILQDIGQNEAAISVLNHALTLAPDGFLIHQLLVNLYLKRRDIPSALAHAQAMETLYSDALETCIVFGAIYTNNSQINEAEYWYEKACRLYPQNGIMRIKNDTLLPAICSSKAQLDFWRSRFETRLRTLLQYQFHFNDPIRELGAIPTFYLAYQNQNDRPIQQMLGELFSQIIPAVHHVAPPNPKPRIGFISRYMTINHTIGRFMLGLIDHLPRDQFDVVVFKVSPAEDIPLNSPHTYLLLPGHLQQAQEMIAARQLDILFYADIGMDPLTYYLAYSRLARIQCVTWGHPVTTGIPTMDYFISSTLIEPEGAQDHYSEKLICLNSLPTYYYQTPYQPVGKPRSYFGLPETGHLYLCPQSMFKLHPDFDAVLGAILQRDPTGFLVLIEGHFEHWAELLKARFAQFMPNEVDRIYILPRMPGHDCLELMGLCDVMLDTFYFGGGNTSFEAFSYGVPVVTMPGNFMRGRVTYGCYQQMGLLDCVVSSPEAYVEKALQLAHDAEYRAHIRSEILARNHKLFENQQCIDELAQSLTQMLQAALSHTVG